MFAGMIPLLQELCYLATVNKELNATICFLHTRARKVQQLVCNRSSTLLYFLS